MIFSSQKQYCHRRSNILQWSSGIKNTSQTHYI